MKPRTDFFNAGLTYYVLIILFVLVRISTAVDLFSFLGDAESYILNGLIQIGFMFLVPVVMFTLLNKQSFKTTFKDFRFNKINFKSVLISIGIGVLVFLLNIAVSSFFSFILQLFGYNYSTGGGTIITSYPFWMFLVNLLITAILPGFCEEVAHRGLLLRGFKDLGMKKAIILSALLFGLMHLNIEQFFYASIIGALLAFLTISTNSIFPAMIVHFMNNGISVYLDYAGANNLFLGDFLSEISSAITGSNFFVAMLIILLVLIAAIFLLVWLIYLLFKQTTGKRIGNLVKDFKEQFEPNAQTDAKQENTEGALVQPESQTSYLKEVSLKIPAEYIGINIHQTRKPAFKEKIFLYSTLILSMGVTISTFIWGTL